MISVKHLTKTFGSFTAVDDLSFDVEPGDVLGFLGPNGAGKSTTMKMLTGFLTPSHGEIRIFQHNVVEDPKPIQKRLGYLPEGAPAYGDMTPFQFLHFIADVRELKGTHRKQRLDDVIGQVQLEDVLDKPIDNLSKGFKRRVGLAQAILHDPDLLILDEPTDGLDPNQKHQVRSLIQNLAKDKLVVVSTHILEEVTAVCNRVMIIAGGKKHFDDTPLALQKRSRFYQAITLHFGKLTDISGLAEIPGVDEMEVDHQSGRVTLFPEQNADLLPNVTQYIQQRQLPVDTMFVEPGRLDDVFREITLEESA